MWMQLDLDGILLAGRFDRQLFIRHTEEKPSGASADLFTVGVG